MKNRGRHRRSAPQFVSTWVSVGTHLTGRTFKKKKTSRQTANKNSRNQKHIRSGVCFIYGSTQNGANLLQQQTLTISHSTSERRSWFCNPSNNKTKQQQSLINSKFPKYVDLKRIFYENVKSFLFIEKLEYFLYRQ